MIRFEGALTEDERAEFAGLASSLSPGNGDQFLFYGVATVAFAFSMLIRGASFLLSAGPLAIGLGLCGLGWWLLQAPRRAWRKNPAFREPYRGTVAEEALDIHLAGTEARLPWAMFDAHQRARNVMLLRAGNRVIPLARGFFASEEHWQRATALAAQAGKALPSRRARLLRMLLGWSVLLLVVYGSWRLTQPRQPEAPPPADESSE